MKISPNGLYMRYTDVKHWLRRPMLFYVLLTLRSYVRAVAHGTAFA